MSAPCADCQLAPAVTRRRRATRFSACDGALERDDACCRCGLHHGSCRRLQMCMRFRSHVPSRRSLSTVDAAQEDRAGLAPCAEIMTARQVAIEPVPHNDPRWRCNKTDRLATLRQDRYRTHSLRVATGPSFEDRPVNIRVSTRNDRAGYVMALPAACYIPAHKSSAD